MKALSKKFRILLWGILCFILIIIGAIINVEGQNLTYEGNKEKDNAILIRTGELSPFKVDFSKGFYVVLGSVTIGCSSQELEQGINLKHYIDFNINYPIKIKFLDNRLSVSAEIRNSENVTIAKITDNQWSVSQESLLVKDRNYNSYAFEVIDSDAIPVLQVVMIGDNQILIGCLVYSENGTMLVNQKGGIMVNPSEEWIAESKNSTIFKYPSSKYLGQTVNPIPYSDDPLLEANNKITQGNTNQIVGTVVIASAPSIPTIIEVCLYFVDKKKNKKEVATEKSNQIGNTPNQYFKLQKQKKEQKRKKSSN